MFAGSEGSVISLDELLPLNLLDLKEKVGSLPVEIELPSAPLREEIIDLLLDRCLGKKASSCFRNNSSHGRRARISSSGNRKLSA